MRFIAWNAAVCVVMLALLVMAADGAERRAVLLNVSQGDLPNDTALEDQTKLTIGDAPRELGVKAQPFVAVISSGGFCLAALFQDAEC